MQLFYDCNHFYFYENALRQFCNTNTASCRLVIAHCFCIDGIECSKVLCNVLQKAGCLDNIVKACTSCFQNFCKVLHDLTGLTLDICCFYLSGCRIDGNLTRGLEGVANLNSLRIRADGIRCSFGVNRFHKKHPFACFNPQSVISQRADCVLPRVSGGAISLRPPLMVTSYLQFLSLPVAVGESLLLFVEKSEWEQPADQSTNFKPAFVRASRIC